MTKAQFGEWLKVHCGLFDGVRRFVKAETLDEWEQLLASTPLDAAIAASRRIYDSEIRPKEYSDHAAAVKRAAAEIVRADSAKQHFGTSKGELESNLRLKCKNAWNALDARVRKEWIAKAEKEIGVPVGPDHFGWDLVIQYAETLHAEQCHPADASRIRNVGWTTLGGVESGASPPNGW